MYKKASDFQKSTGFPGLRGSQKIIGRYEVHVKLTYWQRFGGKDEVPQKVERLDVIPTSTRKDAIRRAKDRLRSKNTVRSKVVDTDTGKVIFDAVP